MTEEFKVFFIYLFDISRKTECDFKVLCFSTKHSSRTTYTFKLHVTHNLIRLCQRPWLRWVPGLSRG